MRPRSDTHVCDLVVDTHGAATDLDGHSMDAGILLDEEARLVYRRRLEEIEEDMEESRALGDQSRLERAGLERDLISRELARAVGSIHPRRSALVLKPELLHMAEGHRPEGTREAGDATVHDVHLVIRK